MAKVPHELRPLCNGEPLSIDNASTPTLVEKLTSDKACHQLGSGWSVTRHRVLCHALHATLLLIHVVLLVLRMLELDHHFVGGLDYRIDIPSPPYSISIPNNIVANAITAGIQTFFTLYGMALVAITQQLALRRNLLQYQTLTETHDMTAAWQGLGMAIPVFWKQPRVAVGGVALIVLYLCGITGVHITSPLILTLETFPCVSQVNKTTVNGMQNLTDFHLRPYWNTATALVRAAVGYSEMPTIGLHNATLYETLVPDGAAFGNATVNAVTFEAQCHSFPNVSTTVDDVPNEYNVTVTYESGKCHTFPPFYPLYENVTRVIGAQGKTVTILTTPPVLDANGDAGSTFEIPSPSNNSEPMTLQITTCALSLVNRTAVINAQTNALVNINEMSSPANSTWTPLLSNQTMIADHQLNWFAEGWNRSSLTTEYYTPASCSECFLSFLDEYIMTFLDRKLNVTAADPTAVATTPNTLNELEDAVAHVASAAAWAVLTTSGYCNISSGETSVSVQVTKTRLNINVIPVTIGLTISIILLGISIRLTRDPRGLPPDCGVQAADTIESTGILEVIWLSSQHSIVQKRIASVQSPSLPELRKAGLFHVALGHPGRLDIERDSGIFEEK